MQHHHHLHVSALLKCLLGAWLTLFSMPIWAEAELITEPVYSFPAEKWLINHQGDVNAVAFAPDGLTAVSGSDDRTLRLWRVDTGQQIRVFRGHTGQVRAVTFAPDGHSILSGSDAGTLKLWDVQTGQALRTFHGHTHGIKTVAFTPDGQTVLSNAWDNSVKLWNVHTGQEIWDKAGHHESIKAVAFSPDGQIVVSGYWRGHLKFWEVKNSREIHFLEAHGSSVDAIAFAPDGKTVLSGSFDERLKLWDVETGELLKTFWANDDHVLFGPDFAVNAVAFAPDAQTILSGTLDNSVRLWDMHTTELAHKMLGHTEEVLSVAYAPDGNTVLSGSADDTVKLWDVQTGHEIRQFGYSHHLNALAISPDGRYLASAGMNNEIQLWDASTGQAVQSWLGHTLWVNSVAFAPDGQTLLSGSADHTLKLWDLQSGQALQTFVGHTKGVASVAFAPNGLTVLSGSRDGTLKLWDRQTGAEIHTFHGHNLEPPATSSTILGDIHINPVVSVAFAPDGQTVLSGSWATDNSMSVKLWDVQTGSEIRAFKSSDNRIQSVAFAPDGQTVLAGGADGILDWWDIHADHKNSFVDYDMSDIVAVAFAPAGQTVVLASSNRIALWDIKTKQIIRTFAGTQAVTSIALSPSGRYIYAGSADATFKVWDSGLTAQPPLILPATLVLNVDETYTITPTAGTPVRWESHNPHLASVDASGTLTAHRAGRVMLNAYDADGVAKTLPVTIQRSRSDSNSSPGRAILIASSWPAEDNSLFDITEASTLRVYRLLKSRGFSDEDIIYFNPRDKRQVGAIVDGHLLDNPMATLDATFTDIAETLQPGQQFVFYVHSHAAPNLIHKLNPALDLTAGQLARWCNRLPDFAQQLIVLDMPYAGSFLDELSGTSQRIVMTSTAADGVTWNQRLSNFTDLWVDQMSNLAGQGSLAADFDQVEAFMTKKSRYAGQQPQLDDNGDGVYDARDGQRAAQHWLGQLDASATPPPAIVEVHPFFTTLPGSKGLLWVKVNPEHLSQVRGVQARLSPVKVDSLYAGFHTRFNRLETQLVYNAAQDRYQIELDFPLQGDWEIEYRAVGVDGNWSVPVMGEAHIVGATVPAHFDPKLPVQILPLFNQSRYRTGDTFLFNLDLKGQLDQHDTYDVYASILFPDGGSYNFGTATPTSIGAFTPYRSGMNLRGERRFMLLNTTLPELPVGTYQGCGLITPAGSDPAEPDNWAHLQCEAFEVE